MKLGKYLEKELGLSSIDTVGRNNKSTVKKFVKTIEERGTEDNVISTLERFKKDNANDIIKLAFLDGVADRLLSS